MLHRALPCGPRRAPRSAVRAEATAGWAGRGAGPVPPPRAPTCPPDLAAQSRGIAQLSLPVRPRRRSRPGRCPPPPPHARPGCLRWRGRATPRDSRLPRPPEVRRPGPDGAGGQRPGPEPQVRRLGVPRNSWEVTPGPRGPGTKLLGCRPGTGAPTRDPREFRGAPRGPQELLWKVCAGWNSGDKARGERVEGEAAGGEEPRRPTLPRGPRSTPAGRRTRLCENRKSTSAEDCYCRALKLTSSVWVLGTPTGPHFSHIVR